MRPRKSIALALAGLALSLCGLPVDASRRGRPAVAPRMPAWALEAAGRTAPEPHTDIVWLHDELNVEPLAEGGVWVRRRVAGKILNVTGMDLLSTHAVAYRRGDEVTKLQGWSLAPDRTHRASDPKKNVTDMPAGDGFSVHRDSRVRRVSLPGAVVGAFVAFESGVKRQLDTGADSFWFGYPERSVAFSRFSLTVPEGFHFETVMRRTDGDVTIEEERSERRVVLTAHDLLPPKDEPYLPPSNEMLPSVWARWWDDSGTRGYKSWDDVATWYRTLADPVLKDAGEAAELSRDLKPQGADGFLKALTGAFDFAARTVRYVSIQIGIGGYQPYSPAVVCKNRFGDCKDKTFLMRALVDSWGTKSYPILVRTRDLGELEPDVPSPGQFNHCIVAIALPDGVGETLWNVIEVEGLGRLAVLDATARNLGPWDLPRGDQETLGLLVHDGGGALVRLPSQPAPQAATSRKLEATMQADGSAVRGTLTESWSGTAAGRVRGYYQGKSDDQRRRDVARDLSKRFRGMHVDEYRIVGLDDPGLDILERTTASGGRLGRRIGDLLIVELGQVAHGLVATLPVPPRHWPLRIGQPRQETVEVSIALPAGWIPEGLPETVEISSQDISAQADWSLESGRLIYRRTASSLNSVIPPERYEAFREQIGRINRADHEGIALVPTPAQ